MKKKKKKKEAPSFHTSISEIECSEPLEKPVETYLLFWDQLIGRSKASYRHYSAHSLVFPEFWLLIIFRIDELFSSTHK